MAKVTVQVTATSLNIRTGPSTSYKSIGTVSKGAKLSSSKQSNGWYYIDSKKGWASGVSSSYLKVVSNSTTTSSKNKAASSKKGSSSKIKDANSKGKSGGIDKKVLNMMLANAKESAKKLDGSTRLFGSPYQFTQETDFRPTKERYNLGRKYLETIVAEAPIVYFMPGKPNYLPEMARGQKEAITNFFKGKGGGNNKDILDKILGNNDVRYFDFTADYSTYIKYVNLLCRASAIYMGLGESFAPVDKGWREQYKWFDWSNYRYEDRFKGTKSKETSIFDSIRNAAKSATSSIKEALFGEWQYTQFYVDAATSFQESSSNQTTDSKLAGMFDTGQGLMKELAFFANAGGAASTAKLFSDGAKSVNAWASKLGDGIFSRLAETGSLIVQGSNIVFPEIWGNSNYNKSYNITINLVSAYGDKESIYLNIIVPLMHLLALAAPRQTSANSFTNPFLVKVTSKGWFNCEMGIIDNISIEKVQGSYSVNGIPTEVKVQIGIKDLYSTLFIASSSQPILFFENKSLINWLAVTCGLDIVQPSFTEKWNSMLYLLLDQQLDAPGNIFNTIKERLKNALEPLWKV